MFWGSSLANVAYPTFSKELSMLSGSLWHIAFVEIAKQPLRSETIKSSCFVKLHGRRRQGNSDQTAGEAFQPLVQLHSSWRSLVAASKQIFSYTDFLLCTVSVGDRKYDTADVLT
jgi:hypothetical protein